MDSSQGYTISPQIIQGDDGTEQLVDFTIDSGITGGQWLDPHDMYEDQEGAYHHHFEDVELGSDQSSTESDADQMIIDSIFELYPDYEEMMAWAGEYYTDDFVELFDSHADSYNFDELLPMIEQIRAEYETSGGYIDDGEYGEEYNDEEYFETAEEWFDTISEEQLDDTIDELFNQDYTDDDISLMHAAMLDVEPESIHHKILTAGVDIALGALTTSQAIEAISAEFGEAEAAYAYYELQHYFNN